MIGLFKDKAAGYYLAVIGISLVSGIFAPSHTQISSTTVALALLLVVLLIATGWGSAPAYFASVFGVLCFNLFFLPPVGMLTIADPQNWVALFAFLITALIVGQLSARARQRADVAEDRMREIERLYEELKEAFDRASEAEALRRSERLKSALLDAVTHDLRTPLTSIKASVTTLLAEDSAAGTTSIDEEGQRELLEVIDQESDRLNRFVESMVEMAQLEAGATEFYRRWGAIDDIIETVLARSGSLTRQHRLEMSIEKELPVAHVDAHALAEVIYTLIDNAAKYSPRGTRIILTADRDGDDQIRIVIEDEGPGVPVKFREKIFDKFFRVPGNGQQHSPALGFGMGLAIARAIVEAHSGRIWIEDGANGRGSRFVLTIPIGDDQHDIK